VQTIIAVSDERDWRLEIPGVRVIRGQDYLTQETWSGAKDTRVFNLCRTYRYQSEGYYVSLLATARGHRAFPALATILDMRSRTIVRSVDDELDELIQRSLAPIKSDEFVLSIYFGQNLAKRYERLATKLFNLFPAPLLRADFSKNHRWRLARIAPIPAREIPKSHFPFVLKTAREYFARPRYAGRQRRQPRYDLAILHDPEERLPPSNEGALKRFARAAEKVGFGVDMITKEDFNRVPEFDALFIRETTYVNHHTFRFAQRAQAEGLVVVDDPQSIIRCTNKVYLAEALQLQGLPMPITVIVNKRNLGEIAAQIGLPCVLKHPDSAFSQGVKRCETEEELLAEGTRILESTDLFIAQEYLPTGYDWRIGVFEGEALYACRYHMARNHWQVVRKDDTGDVHYGRVESEPLDMVPPIVVRTAVRASRLMGNGLYGVDLKQIGRRLVVIEVNDNPNIDSGLEDAVLRDELYRRIMRGLLRRVERRKETGR